MINQTGNGLIVGILIGLLIAGGVFGVYYLGKKSMVVRQPTLQNITVNSSQPTAKVTPVATQSSSKVESWDSKNNTFVGKSIYGGGSFSLVFPPSCNPVDSSDTVIKCQIGDSVVTAIPESGGRGSTWQFVVQGNVTLGKFTWERSAATIGDNKTLFIFYGGTIDQNYYYIEFRVSNEPAKSIDQVNQLLIQTDKIVSTFKHLTP